jgi:uncharacterized membrane-anchored protein YitT (DUF2179 family)
MKVFGRWKRLSAPQWHRTVARQGMIAVGAGFAALAYALFQVPFQIAAGGVGGFGIVVNHFTGWPVGLVFFALNLPLMWLGYRKLDGMRFVASTVFAVVVFSAASDAFVAHLPNLMRRYPLSEDLLLNAIYAGIIYGLGSGLIYRAGGTIGGTSIPARIIHKTTGFSISQSYLFTDLAVILLAGFVFSWEKAMLALLALLLGGMTADFVLEGASQVRTAMIVTDKPVALSGALMQHLGRGVSVWPVVGAFTDTEHTMIYCTVRRSQIFDLRYTVSRLDPDAFLVVGVAQNAWGTGFSRLE